jgi:glycine cleavage system H protein
MILMKVVEGLLYSEEHEWVNVDGDTAYIGITDYAQNSLGDIVFFELPEVGTVLEAGDVLSTVDSVKAASEIYSPISGTVIKVNEQLADVPETANEDPYESWIAAVSIKSEAEIDELMDSEQYEKYCESEAE